VGDGFLRGMVRSLVGTLLDVGLGRRTVASFAALLAGAERSAAGPTAPAHGLTLERVWYADV
jgi:tRNA pseudouridine38-40 synthase